MSEGEGQRMEKKKKFILPIAVVLLAVIGYIVINYTGLLAPEGGNDLVFSGTVEAQQFDVSAEVSGRIKEIKVEEGQPVEAGSILAIIDTPENRIRAAQSETSAESAKNELLRLEEGNREEEINIQRAVVKQGTAAVNQAENAVRQGEALTGQAEQSLKSAQETYSLKKSQYDDIKRLVEIGASTKKELEDSEYALNTAAYAVESAAYSVESAKAQLSSLIAQAEGAKAQLAASQEKLELLLKGAAERSIKASEYGVQQAEYGLELARLSLDKSEVVAARKGVIDMINFSEGEYVGVGSPLITIIDPADLWVKIYVPERVLPSLEIGKSVSISCDYLKDRKINGKIVYISPEAEFTPVNIVTKEDRMKLVFAVKVKILDNLDSIKSGMLLDINVE